MITSDNKTNSPFFEEKCVMHPNPMSELHGLHFAVKSIISVAGCLRSFGNQLWDYEHRQTSESSAPCVQKLLEAGAICKGTLQSSAFCFDLSGENSYGMPRNPKVERGVVGGSSSGCASAVSQGLVDFAFGTDTGGSIRIPASYCGIWSLRPTYRSISTQGVIPVGPATDVVGLMAADVKILHRVTKVLLGNQASLPAQRKLYIIKEMMDLCAPEYRQQLEEKLSEMAPHVQLEKVSIDTLFDQSGALAVLQDASNLLLHDTWSHLSPWLEKNIADWQLDNSPITKEVRANLKLAKEMAHALDQQVQDSEKTLKKSLEDKVAAYKDRLCHFLKSHQAFLIIPTVPGVAPKCDEPLTGAQVFQTISLTCLASLLGLPQMQMPLIESPKGPLGLSLISFPDSDIALTAFGEHLHQQMILRKKLGG
ncbi:MAG: hypothetical protein LLG04_03340 [Parachlamydia sp.]|nr:hypothetical protein [Parachlamydia sp.]